MRLHCKCASNALMAHWRQHLPPRQIFMSVTAGPHTTGCETCGDLLDDYRTVANLFKDAAQNSMEAWQANRKVRLFIHHAERCRTCNALLDDFKHIDKSFWEGTRRAEILTQMSKDASDAMMEHRRQDHGNRTERASMLVSRRSTRTMSCETCDELSSGTAG